MARSLNKVQLIGNLTRDPELRYTPQGSAVCTFGLATNRQWKTETGDSRDEAEFHRLVAWNQLAEICNKLLGKGDRVFAEGRLQTREWTGQDGQKRQTTEIVLSEMILLTSRSGRSEDGGEFDVPEDFGGGEDPFSDITEEEEKPKKKKEPSKKAPKGKEEKEEAEEEDDDIPF